MEEERVVTYKQGESYSQELGVNMFLETSAKTGFNAQKIFVEAAKILYEDYLKYKEKSDPRTSSVGSFRPLHDTKPKEGENESTKKKKCC